MIKQKLANYKVILGSKSPRRINLLQKLDIDFEVKTINIAETYPKDLPIAGVPVYLALKKSQAFGQINSSKILLITADTIVSIDNQVLGKPQNASEAKQMLTKLSGRKHQVITGVCIRSRTLEHVFSSITNVWFRELNSKEIDYYIDNYKPFDKAGAYGIQEWIGYAAVEKIEGSYYNIVGLPVEKLYTELSKII